MSNQDVVALVEDDAVVRSTLRLVLASQGLAVKEFDSATEALDSGMLANVQCLITDFEMPVMDGSELQFHARGRYPHLPIVFISGCIDEEKRRRVMRCGAFAYLSKPTHCLEMIGTIFNAIKTGRAALADYAANDGLPARHSAA